MRGERCTETTAGVAGLATVIVSAAALLTAKSGTVASFIHRTIAGNVSNLATFLSAHTRRVEIHL